VFGEATRILIESLPSYITRTFDGLDEKIGREIVLVGHVLQEEVATLDSMGVETERLPVTGTVDTLRLSQEVLGQGANLGRLVDTLHIERIRGSLHSAGNDSHYTMQVLLALMQRQHGEMICVEEIIRKSTPPPKQRTRKPSVDWEVHFDASLWEL
jgi:DNA polymerase III alpha subunit (gram-positive type)